MESTPLLPRGVRRQKAARLLAAGLFLATTTLIFVVGHLSAKSGSFSPIPTAMDEEAEAFAHSSAALSQDQIDQNRFHMFGKGAKEEDLPLSQPTMLFSQWTHSDELQGDLAGGLTNISCHSVHRLLKAPVFTFVGLWLQEHTGCTGGGFVCEAAFMEALQTRSVWVRGTCGKQPAVYGFHVARPDLDVSASHHDPAKGMVGEDAPVVTSCETNQTMRDGTIIHRSAYEKLKCELQLLQVVLVAASLKDLAVPSSVISSRPHAIMIAPHYVLSSVDALSKRMNGAVRPTLQILDQDNVVTVLPAASHPTSYDFTQQYPYCEANQIVSQGDCGACYAFAGMKVYSSALCSLTAGSINVDLSEQQAISCYNNDGCAGGWASTLFDTMDTEGGWSTRRCLPYQGKDANDEGGVTCNEACTDDTKYTVASSARISYSGPTDDVAIEAALVKYGPLWGCIRVCPGLYTYSGSGVYSDAYTSDCTDCSHAVTIVGYTATTWRIANSWGVAWGDGGFANIARGANMALQLEWTYFLVPTVPSTACVDPPRCLNGGSFDANCACYCPAGYGGKDCSLCTLTCNNGGVVNTGTCSCTCAAGYFGPDCSDSLKLSWSAYDSASLTAAFTLTYSLSNFYDVPPNQRSNVLQRYSDPSRAVWCSNCNQANITSASGSLTLSNENLKLGFSRPNFEHCYSVLLSRGTNQFGIAQSPVRIDFPCLYLRPSTTLPGGYCIDGGTPIVSKKDPMYEYQCTVPNPTPVSTCTNTVHASTCSYWKGRGYCATTSIYFPYVSVRCALTCGLTC